MQWRVIVLLVLHDLFLFSGCPEKCVSGFSNWQSIEKFFNTNPNVNLVSYLGFYRVTQDLSFSCNTTITHIDFGAKPVPGNSSSEITILRPGLTQGFFFSIHSIKLTNITSTEEPGVYRYWLPVPIPVQTYDTLSIYEPENSTLQIFTEKHSSFDGHLLANRTKSTKLMPLSGDDLPLITLDTSKGV